MTRLDSHRRYARLDIEHLLSPYRPKSISTIAARHGQDHAEALHHFRHYIAALDSAADTIPFLECISIQEVARLLKAGRMCDTTRRFLIDDMGLVEFDGRTWAGLHRHLLLACIAYFYRLCTQHPGVLAGTQEARIRRGQRLPV